MNLSTFIVSLFSVSIFASSVNLSQQNLKANKILKAIKPDRVTHFSILEGPTLGGNMLRSDELGNETTNGIFSWHQISLQYDINDRVTFIANPRFMIFHTNPNDNGETQNVRAEFDTPVFGFNFTYFTYKNLTFTGSINSGLFLRSDGATQDTLKYNPGGFQVLNLKVDNKNDVGAWIWGRYREYERPSGADRFPVFVAPYYSHVFSDSFSTTTFYQYNGNLTADNKAEVFTDDHLGQMFNFRVNKFLTVQPMVLLYRASDFNLSRGNINVWLSGVF